MTTLGPTVMAMISQNAPGRRRILAIAVTVIAGLGLAACGSGHGGVRASVGGARTLIGAGSTLVDPLMSHWQPAYDATYGVAVTYGAIGSGGGIAQVTGRSVNFGASDAPLTAAQASECRGCLEIPWALAATDVAYHVEGVPDGLHFTGPVLADIFMGRITTWNDPAIERLNPGVHLPATAIVPVHRVDGSGDTYAFTSYLSAVSPEFASRVGTATTVSWPGGLGGRGNSGVGGVLSSTNGAIAYIAIAYVMENRFDHGLVENAAGRYPTPDVASIAAAAHAVTAIPSAGTQGISLTDPPRSAAAAYPISTFSYVIVPRTGSSAPVSRALRRFIDWAITRGQANARAFDFAPLPAPVVAADMKTIRLIQ